MRMCVVFPFFPPMFNLNNVEEKIIHHIYIILFSLIPFITYSVITGCRSSNTQILISQQSHHNQSIPYV
jgi:hypothetical protein